MLEYWFLGPWMQKHMLGADVVRKQIFSAFIFVLSKELVWQSSAWFQKLGFGNWKKSWLQNFVAET